MTHYSDWGVDDDERADDYEPDGPDPDDLRDEQRDRECCYECWRKDGGDE